MDTYEEGYDGFAFLHVSWWYPPAGATAYVLEQFDSSGNHADIQSYGARATNAVVSLGGASPAGALQFRLRVEPGGHTSNTVTIHRTIVAPSVSVAPTTSGVFEVHYDQTTEVVDKVILSRRTVHSDGTASGWVSLATGRAGTNVYVDTDLTGWVDGAAYEYQAAASVGAELGAAASAKTFAARYLPPRIISLTPIATG